jgi:hypothetical protein
MGNAYIHPNILNTNDIENNNSYNNDINDCDTSIKSDSYDNKEKNNDDYLKNVKNRTIVIDKNIKAIIYKNCGEYGDFDWMIRCGYYNHVLFIFDDNIETYSSDIAENGYNKIKKFNEFNNPHEINSAGIIMGSIRHGCFNKLDNINKNIIDKCIDDIQNILYENKHTEIYFLSDKSGLIKSELFGIINKDIVEYITSKICNLSEIFDKV